MIRSLLAATLLFVGLAVAPARAADPDFPPLTGRVVDQAGVLSEPIRDRLTAELATHEKQTGQQVVVATVKTLGGTTIEDYGVQLGRKWGIGQKGTNTGAILLVAPTERKVRIEVGYGLEGDLTDADSAYIIDRLILPAFRQGNLSAGIVAGTDAILRRLSGNPAAVVSQQPEPQRGGGGSAVGSLIFTILIFVFFMWVMRRSRGGMGSMILPYMIASSLAGRRGGGMSFGSGGGFSGGGFSGGGGSFGGGGASGSW